MRKPLLFSLAIFLQTMVAAAADHSWLQYQANYTAVSFSAGHRSTRAMRLELRVPRARIVPSRNQRAESRSLLTYDASNGKLVRQYTVVNAYVTSKTSVFLGQSEQSTLVLILDGAVVPRQTQQDLPMRGILLFSEGGGSITATGTYHVPPNPRARH